MSRYSSIWVPQLQGAFLSKYEAGVGGMWATDVGSMHNIDTEVGKYIELASAGAVKQWVGNRSENTPKAYTMQLSNVPYESGFSIPTEDVNRDSIGIYGHWSSEVAAKFADHWNGLLATLLTGSGTNTFDGLAFFSASHNQGDSGTQKNLLTNSEVSDLDVTTAAAPTPDEMAKVIINTVGYMQTYLDEAGDPINGMARKFTLLSSNPKIIASARQAISAMFLTSGASNPLVGMESDGYSFRAVLEPRLGAASSAVFYLCRTDSEIKPFIMQEETGVQFDTLAEGSDYAVQNRMYFFGAHAFRAAGYGRWQHAVKATLS